jgi:hypothetical protein
MLLKFPPDLKGFRSDGSWQGGWAFERPRKAGASSTILNRATIWPCLSSFSAFSCKRSIF